MKQAQMRELRAAWPVKGLKLEIGEHQTRWRHPTRASPSRPHAVAFVGGRLGRCAEQPRKAPARRGRGTLPRYIALIASGTRILVATQPDSRRESCHCSLSKSLLDPKPSAMRWPPPRHVAQHDVKVSKTIRMIASQIS